MQVAYASKACHSFSEQDLEELLATARIKNKALGLSGLLLYQDGAFMQFLEGQRHAVDDLLRTIRADERHDGMKLIWHRAIGVRDFEDWQMGFLKSKRDWDQAGFVDVLSKLSRDDLQLHDGEAEAQYLIGAFKEIRLKERVGS
jgi:hypothetical protein